MKVEVVYIRIQHLCGHSWRSTFFSMVGYESYGKRFLASIFSQFLKVSIKSTLRSRSSWDNSYKNRAMILKESLEESRLLSGKKVCR